MGRERNVNAKILMAASDAICRFVPGDRTSHGNTKQLQNSLADPKGKKRKMEILIQEDARKQKEEERKDREEERKIRIEQREEKEYKMKEFEKITDLLRKNRQDRSEATLSLEEREDLLFTQRLLMNEKKKLQQILFSTS